METLNLLVVTEEEIRPGRQQRYGEEASWRKPEVTYVQARNFIAGGVLRNYDLALIDAPSVRGDCFRVLQRLIRDSDAPVVALPPSSGIAAQIETSPRVSCTVGRFNLKTLRGREGIMTALRRSSFALRPNSDAKEQPPPLIVGINGRGKSFIEFRGERKTVAPQQIEILRILSDRKVHGAEKIAQALIGPDPLLLESPGLLRTQICTLNRAAKEVSGKDLIENFWNIGRRSLLPIFFSDGNPDRIAGTTQPRQQDPPHP